MTIDQMRARLEELRTEILALAEIDQPTDEQAARWQPANDEFDTLERQIADHEAREARVAHVRAVAARPSALTPGTPLADPARTSGSRDGDPLADPNDVIGRRSRSNPFDLDALRATMHQAPERALPELRARALDAVELTRGLSDQHRENVTQLIERLDPLGDDEDVMSGTARIYRHIVAVSSPEYVRSWSRAFRASLRGGRDPEAETVLARAASLTDNAGGFAIPVVIDPTLILTSNGSVNPFRQISRVVPVVTDTWNGVSTTHASWSWDGEAGEVSDDATTFAQPSITVHKLQGFIPFSIEIGQDYPGFTDDVFAILSNGRDDAEAAAFATGAGNGSNQPVGIVTALTGTSSVVASAGADAFAVADVYNVEEALPAKYRARADWVANKTIYNDIRQFGTAHSHALWERIGAGQPAELLGYPAREASAMDGTYGSGENYVLILGDFQNYVIADRVGMSMELIPHLFATGNNRPSGQRGFYAYLRVGADSVNDGAFRMLNVT